MTAAVVGVILNLAIWFGWHVVAPRPGVLDPFALISSLLIFAGLVKWNWNVVPVVLGSAAFGVLFKALF